ncbi:type II secretion system protein [Caloranaerobacter azorensis]|uniref:type II secretion system protein n=1 Tax=Caloranaerobacter azorensis TaxID=116090 RepID=UPI00068EED40|nr:type II secretion system protein [Caloranaerobacter azorensis]
MIKAINKRLRNKKGFTLIELIVVVAVLGILALIAIPKMVGIQDEAKEAVDESNMKLLQNAAELYAAQHNGNYPTKASDFEDYLSEFPEQSGGGAFWFDTTDEKVVESLPGGHSGFEIK